MCEYTQRYDFRTIFDFWIFCAILVDRTDGKDASHQFFFSFIFLLLHNRIIYRYIHTIYHFPSSLFRFLLVGLDFKATKWRLYTKLNQCINKKIFNNISIFAWLSNLESMVSIECKFTYTFEYGYLSLRLSNGPTKRKTTKIILIYLKSKRADNLKYTHTKAHKHINTQTLIYIQINSRTMRRIERKKMVQRYDALASICCITIFALDNIFCLSPIHCLCL